MQYHYNLWNLSRGGIYSGVAEITKKEIPFIVKSIVKVYETGGIPLVLIGVGAFMIIGNDWSLNPPTGKGGQIFFLSGIGLILAGTACWAFDVYLRRQREFMEIKYSSERKLMEIKFLSEDVLKYGPKESWIIEKLFTKVFDDHDGDGDGEKTAVKKPLNYNE